MDAFSFVTASLSSVYTMAIENVTKQHNTVILVIHEHGEIRKCETINFKTYIYLIVNF